MTILFCFLFLAIFLHNYNLKSKTNFNIKKQPLYIVILIGYTLLALYMTYRLNNNASGYALAISSAMVVYSIIFFQGINKEFVLVFLGTSPLLKLIKKEDLKKISMEEIQDKNEIILKIKAFGDLYTQIYDMDKKDEIKNLQ